MGTKNASTPENKVHPPKLTRTFLDNTYAIVTRNGRTLLDPKVGPTFCLRHHIVNTETWQKIVCNAKRCELYLNDGDVTNWRPGDALIFHDAQYPCALLVVRIVAITEYQSFREAFKLSTPFKYGYVTAVPRYNFHGDYEERYTAQQLRDNTVLSVSWHLIQVLWLGSIVNDLTKALYWVRAPLHSLGSTTIQVTKNLLSDKVLTEFSLPGNEEKLAQFPDAAEHEDMVVVVDSTGCHSTSVSPSETIAASTQPVADEKRKEASTSTTQGSSAESAAEAGDSSPLGAESNDAIESEAMPGENVDIFNDPRTWTVEGTTAFSPFK